MMNERHHTRPISHRLTALGTVLGRSSLVVAICAAVVLSYAAHAQCQYEVVEPIIQGPDCQFVGPRPTIPLGMNNLGEAVGYYWDCNDVNINHAFRWKPGEGLTTLPNPPGVSNAFASDINDAGFIVGGHWRDGIGWSGFVRHPDTGEYTYLEALHDGFSVIQTVSTANAINNADPPVVAGSRVVTKPGESPLMTNAVMWWPYREDGSGQPLTLDLGVMNGPTSAANALNAAKDIVVVGWNGESGAPDAFVSIGQQVIIFSEMFNAEVSNAVDVASDGTVGGGLRSALKPLNRGFLLHPNLTLTMIEPLSGFSTCAVTAINDLGQAVLRSNPGNVAGLWQHGVHYSLDDLMVFEDTSLTIDWPRAINGQGQILARGNKGGKQVGVVLAPIDQHPADLDADCDVGLHDLLLLLQEWGPCQGCAADLTGNGKVGVPDLLFMLANWGGR